MKNTLPLLNNKNFAIKTHIKSILCLWLLVFTSCIDQQEILFEGKSCEHYNCADATVIQVTDYYFPHSYKSFKNDSRKFSSNYAEFLGFKYNIPLHVFESSIKGKEFEEFLNTGRGGASIYYPSCQFEFRKSKFDSIRDQIESIYGKCVSTMSYGCGNTNYRDSLPNYILGGRNSGATSITLGMHGITWYGNNLGINGPSDLNKTYNRRSRRSSGRYYADIQREMVSPTVASKYVSEEVRATINNNGFYTNFMHWQDFYSNPIGDTIQGMKVIDSLFIGIREGIGHGTTAKIDYNQAIEYLYSKEAIDSIVLVRTKWNKLELHFEPNKLHLVDYNVIDTPLSIEIPKAAFEEGEFQNIKPFKNIVSVYEDSSKIYLNVLVDWNKEKNIHPISMRGGRRKTRTRFEQMELQLQSDRKVTSNKTGKFVLFRRPILGEAYEMHIIDRTVNFGNNYKLPTFEEGYRYFCGGISDDGESNIIELENI